MLEDVEKFKGDRSRVEAKTEKLIHQIQQMEVKMMSKLDKLRAKTSGHHHHDGAESPHKSKMLGQLSSMGVMQNSATMSVKRGEQQDASFNFAKDSTLTTIPGFDWVDGLGPEEEALAAGNEEEKGGEMIVSPKISAKGKIAAFEDNCADIVDHSVVDLLSLFCILYTCVYTATSELTGEGCMNWKNGAQVVDVLCTIFFAFEITLKAFQIIHNRGPSGWHP